MKLYDIVHKIKDEKDVYVLVPTKYVGGTLRPAGWVDWKTVTGFVPAHTEKLQELFKAVIGWDPDRVLIKVKDGSKFRQKMTGPDRAYHGMVFCEETIVPDEYEVVS